jgi:hypothetical protein
VGPDSNSCRIRSLESRNAETLALAGRLVGR